MSGCMLAEAEVGNAIKQDNVGAIVACRPLSNIDFTNRDERTMRPRVTDLFVPSNRHDLRSEAPEKHLAYT